MNSLELLACLLLVVFSAYLSASEIALFSLSRFQIKSIKDDFKTAYKTVRKLLGDPSGLLMTILILNEMVNIGLSSLITDAVAQSEIIQMPLFQRLPTWGVQTLAGILITSPIILIVCEITPKVIAARLNRPIALLAITPLNLLYETATPIRSVFQYLLHLLFVKRRDSLTRDQNRKEKDLILKESDFLLMVEEGHKEGAIGQSELDLIKNVFDLDDTLVSEVTTPLSEVLTLPPHTSIKDALATFRDRRFSRIPILNTQKKEIVGILYSKDLLQAKLDPKVHAKTVAELMRRPFFVRPNLRLNALFRKFKRQKIHMAVVKDPDQAVVGVVTMSDLLDAVFEDLFADESYRPEQKGTAYSYRYLKQEKKESGSPL